MGKFLAWLRKQEGNWTAAMIWEKSEELIGGPIDSGSLLWMLIEENPNEALLDVLEKDLTKYKDFEVPTTAFRAMQKPLKIVMNQVASHAGVKGPLLQYMVIKGMKVPGLFNMLASIGFGADFDEIRDDVISAKDAFREYRIAETKKKRDELKFPAIDRLRQIGSSDVKNEAPCECGLIIYCARAIVKAYDLELVLFIEDEKDRKKKLNRADAGLKGKTIRAAFKNATAFKSKFDEAKRLKHEEMVYQRAKKKKDDVKEADLVCKSAFPETVCDLYTATIECEDAVFRHGVLPNLCDEAIQTLRDGERMQHLEKKPIYKNNFI
eukprot:g14333.t1